MGKHINIIGGGLSGCEAAYQLAKRGYSVNLYEVKRKKKNEVQKLDTLAELVCSNTFRSSILSNAVGTLKKEMELFDSLIIKCAKKTSIPAGQSLAVDRRLFSEMVTNELSKFHNITIIDKEITNIPKDEVTIIASGPLTTEPLKKEILNLVGEKYFYFFDAIAPTIEKESIDFNIAFIKNRYEKGDTMDYVNCPMNEEQYKKFHTELVNAKTVELKLDNEKTFKVFEGCMPIEVMAKRNIDTMRFGPLKPVGLRNHDGTDNYAVVQLRIDNAAQDAYNMVGFQTNLTFDEQKRVFRLIPGLENANFLKYGQMHENNYINSPMLLNHSLQLKSNKNIFFAGQITGVEGYVESTSTGIVCALNVINFINNKEPVIFPKNTMIGGMINYIITTDYKNFQPSKANWSIANINVNSDKKIKKHEKYQLYSDISLKNIKDFIELINKEEKICI